MNTRCVYSPQHGDRLATKLRNGRHDFRILEEPFQAILYRSLKLLGGQACGVNSSRHWEVNITFHVDPHRRSTDLFGVGNVEADLIIWAEDVVCRGILNLL